MSISNGAIKAPNVVAAFGIRVLASCKQQGLCKTRERENPYRNPHTCVADHGRRRRGHEDEMWCDNEADVCKDCCHEITRANCCLLLIDTCRSMGAVVCMSKSSHTDHNHHHHNNNKTKSFASFSSYSFELKLSNSRFPPHIANKLTHTSGQQLVAPNGWMDVPGCGRTILCVRV